MIKEIILNSEFCVKISSANGRDAKIFYQNQKLRLFATIEPVQKEILMEKLQKERMWSLMESLRCKKNKQQRSILS